MRKRGQVLLALLLVLAAVLAPVSTGYAAGWQYSQDGKWGVIIYVPQEGQTIYTDMGFSFEFDLKVGNTEGVVLAAGLLNKNDGSVVKEFPDIMYAQSNDNGRFIITLNVSDVQPGDYIFMFGVSNANGSQIAADYRNVTIVKRTSGWEKFSGGWSYKINGNWVKNKWELIGGKWYRFNSAGYMLTGWQKIGGSWYYLGSDGAMRMGWHAIGGKWYYFSNSGAMYSNCWLDSNGDWYLLNSSGVMLTGWQRVNGSWYYLQPSSGKMHTGWLSLGGKWYFMDNNGKMVTGTGTINGKRYTFNSSGVWVS